MTAPSPDESAREGASLRALGALGIIGAGAVGGALARALAARGARVVAVTSAHDTSATSLAASIPGCQAAPDSATLIAAADTVLLAVPDDTLAALDAALLWRPLQTVIHLSGARGIDALPHAAARGAAVAALHPLMLFPRPPLDAAGALARLAGCTWALAASDSATTSLLEQAVAALGGHVVRLTESDRVPYHLAAVLASNYIVALLGAAVRIWERLGVAPRDALDALLPLLRATVDNLEALGPVDALTGPVARGDTSTIAAHLAWLTTNRSTSDSSLLAAYVALAELAIPLAVARGTLTESAARALRTLLRASE